MTETVVTYSNIKKFVDDLQLPEKDSSRILKAAIQVRSCGGTIALDHLAFVLNSRREEFLVAFEKDPEHRRIFEVNIAWYREQTEDKSPKIDNIALKADILSFLRQCQNDRIDFDAISNRFPVDTPSRTHMLLDQLIKDGEVSVSDGPKIRYKAIQKN